MGWIIATLIAAAAQTGRNAAQRKLTAQIGTLGATAVRFLFGLPFAALFLLVLSTRDVIPVPDAAVIGWTLMGAAAQIAATALMLRTMESRSFGVTTALIKTEPVTLAIIGSLILSEPLGAERLIAIAIATFGVVLMSGADWRRGGWQAMVLGVSAGALFGLSAIGFRGALISMPGAPEYLRAATVLTLALLMQSIIMLAWFLASDRATLGAIMRNWRGSLGAGFLGAFASLFWFIGFALTAAANVRTLALVEVVMAQVISGKVFREGANVRQLGGMALIVAGVVLLIWVSA